MFKKYRWLWIGGALLVLAGIVITAVAVRNSQVDYIKPRYGPIVEAIYGLGKVKTDRVYEVKLGVIKIVKRIYVREGMNVKRGDRLVSFDNDLVFILIGSEPSKDFLEKLGLKVEGVKPVYNPENYESNIKNLFIAGDLTKETLIHNAIRHGKEIVESLKV